MENPGFDPKEVQHIKDLCKKEGRNFVYNEEEEQSDEFAYFLFVGKHEGKEVVYDAALFTLQLYHSSMVYEKAEEAAEKQFKGYKRRNLDEMLDGNFKEEPEEDAEISLFKMEYMDELEDNDTIKVQEYLDKDLDYDFGIALEVALNLEEIDEKTISNFVEKYNAGTIALDKTLYSFKSGDEEEED
jgi:hypothetical protein